MSPQATLRRKLSRIVVANRGEAAVRFMRAARTWSSQNNEPLETIALYTRADEGARFVRMASRAICLGEAFVHDADGRTRSAYLDIDRIVGLAREAGADGLWPGWGFASEKPELPDACEAADVTFLGPPASAMRALGDKIAAKRLAESCEVPVSAWSGGPVDAAAAQAWAERIGYPVLLKATAGGGGRGIRRVYGREEIADAFRSAAAEAAAAFGDASIFVEALIPEARHIEVQVLADRHGGVWAIGTRNCSMTWRLVRAFSSSCTRTGTSRSPVSNRASAGPMSPMVATRIVSESPSVLTLSRANRSVCGWMRSSGRSRSVSAMTSAINGIRRICAASSSVTLATASLSEPVTSRVMARKPFSSTNQ